MRVTLHEDVDAAYIFLTEPSPGYVTRSVTAEPGSIVLDFDADGRLVGIEVLDASTRLPGAVLDAAERR